MLQAVRYCDKHPKQPLQWIHLVIKVSKKEAWIEPLDFCPKCKQATIMCGCGIIENLIKQFAEKGRKDDTEHT
jgi:hypothetical protein